MVNVGSNLYRMSRTPQGYFYFSKARRAARVLATLK